MWERAGASHPALQPDPEGIQHSCFAGGCQKPLGMGHEVQVMGIWGCPKDEASSLCSFPMCLSSVFLWIIFVIAPLVSGDSAESVGSLSVMQSLLVQPPRISPCTDSDQAAHALSLSGE